MKECSVITQNMYTIDIVFAKTFLKIIFLFL